MIDAVVVDVDRGEAHRGVVTDRDAAEPLLAVEVPLPELDRHRVDDGVRPAVELFARLRLLGYLIDAVRAGQPGEQREKSLCQPHPSSLKRWQGLRPAEWEMVRCRRC